MPSSPDRPATLDETADPPLEGALHALARLWAGQCTGRGVFLHVEPCNLHLVFGGDTEPRLLPVACPALRARLTARTDPRPIFAFRPSSGHARLAARAEAAAKIAVLGTDPAPLLPEEDDAGSP